MPDKSTMRSKKDTYVGETKDGISHVRDKLTLANCCMYEGERKADGRHGSYDLRRRQRG